MNFFLLPLLATGQDAFQGQVVSQRHTIITPDHVVHSSHCDICGEYLGSKESLKLHKDTKCKESMVKKRGFVFSDADQILKESEDLLNT